MVLTLGVDRIPPSPNNPGSGVCCPFVEADANGVALLASSPSSTLLFLFRELNVPYLALVAGYNVKCGTENIVIFFSKLRTG